jgi:hypothetical protein
MAGFFDVVVKVNWKISLVQNVGAIKYPVKMG